MLTCYGSKNSRSLRVVWALEEAQAPYEYKYVALMKGEGRSPAFLAINPGGKVPALQDGEFILTESAAICNYIGALYPDAMLVPTEAKARALYDKWCFFAMSELEQPLWTFAKHTFAIPEKYRVPEVKETAKWEFRVACKVLEAGLQDKPFILGEQFSMADILLSHSLAWATFSQLELPETLAAYAARMSERPAFQRAFQKESEAAKLS
ncbi:MAG: glutathione S-transferase [Deltaproteobacteria bacterium]|nr:glutathione S-transferase [Deltaproteobacteria bacterium]MBU51011.1 glutathione S-transferase [Deltaproteobacteria bacterium]|tara:strand:+ start:6788 stop:7414 length:627 start_codon:yes stop_codon:yes gene_type:complete